MGRVAVWVVMVRCMRVVMVRCMRVVAVEETTKELTATGCSLLKQTTVAGKVAILVRCLEVGLLVRCLEAGRLVCRL